jgi:hypothetical protein
MSGEEAGGGDPHGSGSSGEGGVERAVTLPPSSPLGTTTSPHRDALLLQMGAMTGERRLKRHRAKAGLATDYLCQSLPMKVVSDREGEDDPSVCTSGKWWD